MARLAPAKSAVDKVKLQFDFQAYALVLAERIIVSLNKNHTH
jgi:hypothetical protein